MFRLRAAVGLRFSISRGRKLLVMEAQTEHGHIRLNWNMISILIIGIGAVLAVITHSALGGGSYWFLGAGVVSGLALVVFRKFKWGNALFATGGLAVAAFVTILISGIK